MPNFLEQLVAEWYEFRGYFVRRNVKVGLRKQGGFESELDVVAFNPANKHLVQIEPSIDSDEWGKREKRFSAKFEAGRKYIPSLFPGLRLPEPEQVALLVFASARHTHVGGGRVLLIQNLMKDILSDSNWGLSYRSVNNQAVPEQYVILRSLQFAANYWDLIK